MAPLLAQLAPLFASPGLAIAGAALVAIPIAIHLLWRMHRQPQPWAAMRFLAEAYRRHRSRMRLEQFLLLLVRCLILFTLGLALAGPLLSGCSNRLTGGDNATAPARTIYVLLDDTLSSRTAADGNAGSASRFEQLRDLANKVLDAANPADRIALWTTARPARLVQPATTDHALIRRSIAELDARYSRSDLLPSLASVQESITQEALPPEQAIVIVLSDLSLPVLPTDRPAPSVLSELSRSSRLLVNKPAAMASNTQIASLQPRRGLVLADPVQGSNIATDLKLRRFTESNTAQTSTIQLSLFGSDLSKPLWIGSREHRWAAAQTEATIEARFELPAQAATAATEDKATDIRSLTLQARLDTDALEADNTRFTVIQARQRLLIGLLDAAATSHGSTISSTGQLEPRRWLELALQPMQNGSGPAFELRTLPASALDVSVTSSLDVAFVLRPDLLNDAGWLALRELSQRGGLIWFWAPALLEPAIWGAALREKLGVEWELGIDPLNASTSTAGNTNPSAGDSWGLSTDQPAPESMQLLSADWADLLRPVRIERRLAVRVRENAGTSWLTLADGANSPLLVVAPLGQGHVLLTASALDPAWTNLPVKPLLVPLLHETIRGLLRDGDASLRLSEPATGSKLTLSRAWNDARQLQRVLPGDGVLLATERTESSVTTSDPITLPGVYRAVPTNTRNTIAINIDPDAGQTRTLDAQQLSQWLTAAGPWQWLDPAAPLTVQAQKTQRVNWGWPLLLLTLLLVLLETALARWFSHARAETPVARSLNPLARSVGGGA